MDCLSGRKSFSAEQLTESQRRAVEHIEGALLILAGPGSGKTRVITSRISAMLERGIAPWSICAITFTNKAAEEMRERLGGLGRARGVHISTFHSLCVRLLRQYAQRAGTSGNFSIYDTDEQKRCMKQAVADCDASTGNFAPARMLETISRLKNDLEDVESYAARVDDYYHNMVAKVYRRYQQILTENNALDFDDLLVRTAFLLRDCQDVRGEISNRFRYLLVDEYQDTNHAQYQIARGIAMEHGNICVTGDPDQSIYKWRGADIGNILAFESDWPNAVVIKLEENFRSTPNILSVADKLIAFNAKRKQKILIATIAEGDEPVIGVHDDAESEAVAVADSVGRLVSGGVSPDEIAVFYRMNSMSRLIEEVFVRGRVPYQVVRGVEFYARKEIRDMLSYLKLIVNPSDDIAFVRAVGTHKRGIGKTTVEKIVSYSKQHMLSAYEAAAQVRSIGDISASTQNKVAQFVGMMEKFKGDADGKVSPLMERVFKETGLEEVLACEGDNGQAAIENVGELINAASVYDQSTESPSLVDYLQAIALYSDTDAYDSNAPKVSLMTLHAAKGLEFDNVFIIGLEEGILPHERSMEFADDIEEERRLFFVGITRARKKLTISYARHRVVCGQFMRSTPSNFLYEIGFAGQEESFADAFDSQDAFGGSQEYHAESDEDAFVVNELVEHHKFGLGRVKEFLNLGADSIVVVRFNSGKTKSLMTRYANLTRVGR
jgi:DNA helicase-2/ATP-dependent DNA helicase PcrA